ncbi:hypothetical protein [Aphanothece sacrum]|uniref:Uncharacterized protein n=1 Tax=Aphanothece sacrum FPU1 TaxID=1920663 RepID=A0A401IKD5_APHSA|nr:hypothetical protein [Aphanothece sacrum]GBF81775.1 hypothetical protein AsFPU1_3195 [Aphanothece sacrum FPU1]GBF84307.1 hypothetical protein AsFPU3_1355 [Aphanothece sacrum FPU3]
MNLDDLSRIKNSLFLPKLYFIELEKGLPGGLLPDQEESDVITFIGYQKKPVTPLIPLNSVLLDYFTPGVLVKQIKFKMQNSGQVRLILDLPLTGVDLKQKSYTLYKDYDLKEENCLGEQLPVLQLWPNFRADKWQDYYVFYYDSELGIRTFDVSVYNDKDSCDFKLGFGKYTIIRLEDFPTHINCVDSQRNPIGIILLKSPNIIRPHKKCKIGVDFNTKFTNIYIQHNNSYPEPLKLKNLQLQITTVASFTLLNALFENFIPENFIPQDKPQIDSVLTTLGANPNHNYKLPIFDGRMYIPNNKTFKPQEEHIKTNLSWTSSNREYVELFLKHLALHISALVVEQEIEEIQWCISYPSTFDKKTKRTYAKLWQDITQELKVTTGIKHICPDYKDTDHYRSESVAFAQYFNGREREDLIYTSCIYFLESTSDISVWDSGKQIYQYTIDFGVKDLLHEILQENPRFIKDRLKYNFGGWDNLHTYAFNTKLDLWLRLESENWLKKEREQIADEEDMRGLITIMSIGVAGLYYYIGIVLKVLHQQGIYERGKTTPVYIGGRGSHLLNWLDDRGEFSHDSEINKIFSRLLIKSSGFNDYPQDTHLSKYIGDEIACGLVLNDTSIKGISETEQNYFIPGENCLINGQKIDAYSRIKQQNEQEINDFKIPKLIEIPEFLYEFHKVLKELNIEEISALKDYKTSPDTKDNSELWKRTQRALEDILIKEMKGKSEEIRFEPPFILGLKTLLRVLAKDWAKSSSSKK